MFPQWPPAMKQVWLLHLTWLDFTLPYKTYGHVCVEVSMLSQYCTHLAVCSGDAMRVDGEVVKWSPLGQDHLAHVRPCSADHSQFWHLTIAEVFKYFLKIRWKYMYLESFTTSVYKRTYLHEKITYYSVFLYNYCSDDIDINMKSYILYKVYSTFLWRFQMVLVIICVKYTMYSMYDFIFISISSQQ